MATLTLDTYAFVKTLTEAGVPENQAEAIAEGFQKVNLENIATKQDLVELREQLRVEIRDIKVDLLKWVIPLLLGQAALFAALVKWL